MRDAGKRIDDVEAALTPKQQVLRWLDHVAGLGSEEAYFKWLAERSFEALPRIKLAEAVAEATRKRMRGEPKEAIENVVRRAVRDVDFLTKLVLDINVLVTEKTGAFDLQAALCARGLQLLVVAAAVPRRGQGALPWLDRPVQLQEVLDDVVALLSDIYTLEEAVRLIQRRLFDDHPILFPGRAKRLAEGREKAESVVAEYASLRASGSLDGGEDSTELGLALDALGQAVQPAAAATARYYGDLAEADALWEVGQREAAARPWMAWAGAA
jgi:hypothetical protein